jgi:hypothetical protein
LDEKYEVSVSQSGCGTKATLWRVNLAQSNPANQGCSFTSPAPLHVTTLRSANRGL